jgi:hypothetical protein
MPEINEVLYEETIKINNDMPVHEFNKYLKDVAARLSEQHNIHMDDILIDTKYSDTEDPEIQQLQIIAVYVPSNQTLVFAFKQIHGVESFVTIKHRDKKDYVPNSINNLNLLLQAETRYLRGIQKLQRRIREDLEGPLYDDKDAKNFDIKGVLSQKLITNHLRLKVRHRLVYI